jgi:hypothetical protein
MSAKNVFMMTVLVSMTIQARQPPLEMKLGSFCYDPQSTCQSYEWKPESSPQKQKFSLDEEHRQGYIGGSGSHVQDLIHNKFIPESKRRNVCQNPQSPQGCSEKETSRKMALKRLVSSAQCTCTLVVGQKNTLQSSM